MGRREITIPGAGNHPADGIAYSGAGAIAVVGGTATVEHRMRGENVWHPVDGLTLAVGTNLVEFPSGSEIRFVTTAAGSIFV